MGIECLFMHPDRVIFGQGAVEQLGDCIKDYKGTKAFVVTDKGVAGLEIFATVLKSIANKDIKHIVYSEVDANPTDKQVENAAELYKKENADVLVAVGGGSSIDTAKAVGVLVNNGGSIRDWEGMDLFENVTPPMIAIPTTAGTGSEVTPYSVITNTKDNYKMAICGWKLMAKTAIVDPLLMASMPPIITAATGMDALSHCVEAVYSQYAMPQADALAYHGIKLVAENLENAVKDGSDLDARDGMAMASLMGGMAMCAGCGAVHALGHQLSTQFGMAHGAAMALMMPPVIKFNASSCPEKIAQISVALGKDISGLTATEAAEDAAEAIKALGKSVGLPSTLTAAGADPNLIPTAAKFAEKDGDLPTNPITPNIDEITELYMQVLK